MAPVWAKTVKEKQESSYEAIRLSSSHRAPTVAPRANVETRPRCRFGALFFLLLYLSLLSLTSLPIWREDRRLFLSESMAGAYGHLPYFTSVALADILLIRVIPPLAFAVVGYPLMGLNTAPDNQACLLWFAGILVSIKFKLGSWSAGCV